MFETVFELAEIDTLVLKLDWTYVRQILELDVILREFILTLFIVLFFYKHRSQFWELFVQSNSLPWRRIIVLPIVYIRRFTVVLNNRRV